MILANFDFVTVAAVAFTVAKCCKFNSFTMPPFGLHESGGPVQILIFLAVRTIDLFSLVGRIIENEKYNYN